MKPILKIGTRESELAVWQADLVKNLLAEYGYASTLVLIKSDGDSDQVTPLYEMGVQGIFTKSLDIALLNNSIDIAVHSMKDVPTQMPQGIVQAAVLKRGNYKDIFILNEKYNGTLKDFHASLATLNDISLDPIIGSQYTIATSSVRRKAQWLHRYPKHTVDNLRGNINTRMQKIEHSDWQGAILAAAGVERINLKPASAIELDWMLPAPSQGAIMVACRVDSIEVNNAIAKLNHEPTERCTRIEKDFLRALMGGCSTPISALAVTDKKDIYFRGSMLSLDGKQKIEVEKYVSQDDMIGFGLRMAQQILINGGQEIADTISNGK